MNFFFVFQPVVLIVNKADQEIDREVNELHDEVFSSLASDNAPKESELWVDKLFKNSKLNL